MQEILQIKILFLNQNGNDALNKDNWKWSVDVFFFR